MNKPQFEPLSNNAEMGKNDNNAAGNPLFNFHAARMGMSSMNSVANDEQQRPSSSQELQQAGEQQQQQQQQQQQRLLMPTSATYQSYQQYPNQQHYQQQLSQHQGVQMPAMGSMGGGENVGISTGHKVGFFN
jgi:hypothetical protein